MKLCKHEWSWINVVTKWCKECGSIKQHDRITYPKRVRKGYERTGNGKPARRKKI